jgi:hypothetical protein
VSGVALEDLEVGLEGGALVAVVEGDGGVVEGEDGDGAVGGLDADGLAVEVADFLTGCGGRRRGRRMYSMAKRPRVAMTWGWMMSIWRRRKGV